MTLKNYTPHLVRLNDGREWPSVGIARVSSTHSEFRDDLATVVFGEPEGLPPQEDGVLLIVSGMMAAACRGRSDLVSPATGHPLTVRKDGQVVSVPGFIRA